MTKKTTSRRDRDAKARQLNGGKIPSARVDRERISRAWYDLKGMHANTQKYIAQLAERMKRYANLPVLAQIAKNGESERFTFLTEVAIPQHAATVGVDLQNLWDSHKDRKGRCTTIAEVELAMSIGNSYEKFDTDFFIIFQPIISELNVMFNKALKQLLDEQDEAAGVKIKEAQVKAIDVNAPMAQYEEIPDTIQASPVESLDAPAEIENKIKARGMNPAIIQVDDAAFGTLQLTGKATHAEVAAEPTSN